MRPERGTTVGARAVKGGLLLLALSLTGGLAMSLYAFVPMVRVPAALDAYDDLPRRLLRLAHVAAVALPLLSIVFGLFIDRLRLSTAAKSVAVGLVVAGAAALPAALVIEAVWEAARQWHLAAPPAVAFVLGTAIVAWGAWRTSPGALLSQGS